jgi:hypothetical protein
MCIYTCLLLCFFLSPSLLTQADIPSKADIDPLPSIPVAPSIQVARFLSQQSQTTQAKTGEGRFSPPRLVKLSYKQLALCHLFLQLFFSFSTRSKRHAFAVRLPTFLPLTTSPLAFPVRYDSHHDHAFPSLALLARSHL